MTICDAVVIGLVKSGDDSEQAIVCFAVGDVTALYAKLTRKGIAPSISGDR